MKRAIILFFLIIAAAAAPKASGQRQISFRSTPGQNNFTSEGSPSVFDNAFVFELGAFGSGFTPGPGNTADWASNWTPLGRAQYRSSTRWFSKSTTLEDNGAPFGIGGQAYIWGHNASGEWILLKNDSWTWPQAVGGIDPGGTSFSVSNPGTTAIVGAVNGTSGGVEFQMMTAVASGELPDVVPAQWYVQHFNSTELEDPEITGPLADPDGDGAVNVLELAAGTDPDDPASVRFAEVEIVESSGARNVRASLQRAGRAIMVHALGVSDDLASWDITNTEVDVIEDSSTMLILQSKEPIGTFLREFYQFTLYDPAP